MARRIAYLLIMGTALSFQSCTSKKAEVVEDKKFALTDSLINKLKIDTVKDASSHTELNFSAKITPNEDTQAAVYPMVSGVVGNVTVKLGDKVNKGQVLATLNSAEMAEFDKEAISSNAELKVAERAYKQAEDMYKSGLISAKELEEAKNNLIIKQAEHKKANTVFKLNGGNSKGVYSIVSPVTGYVVEKNVTSNMLLRPDNANCLFKIANLSNVWAMLNIYESDISSIQEGNEVSLSVLPYPERVFKGKIDKIYNVIDNESKVMNARVVISNADLSLKPGMIATVKVTAKAPVNLPTINPENIIFDENKNYVLVLDPQKKIRIQEIEIGRKTANMAYISKGLTPGDRIVASKQVFLFESLKD